MMETPRHQLFSRSALAAYQHRQRSHGCLLYFGKELPHGPAHSNHSVKRSSRRLSLKLDLHGRHTFLQQNSLLRTKHDRAHPVHFIGLGHEIRRSQTDTLHRIRDRVVGGHDNDLGRMSGLPLL